MLAASDLIRFVPNTESFVGSVPPLIVYGLDGSYTGAFTSVSTPVDINVSDFAAVGFTPLDTSVFSAAEPLQTAEWSNTNGGTWNTAGDWSTDSVPNNIDNLIIGDPGSYTVTIPSGSTAVASWLTLSNADATVLDEGTLTITQGLNVVAGVFQFSGGTLSDFRCRDTGGRHHRTGVREFGLCDICPVRGRNTVRNRDDNGDVFCGV